MCNAPTPSDKFRRVQLKTEERGEGPVEVPRKESLVFWPRETPEDFRKRKEVSQHCVPKPRGRGLYIHVPFCVRKCPYCAFYSVAEVTPVLIDRYIRALRTEFELCAAGYDPITVYVGGGTPSILTPGQWEQLFEGLTLKGKFSPEEWTVECNPGTVSETLLRQFREFGVTRISIGVQSLDERVLKCLGRIHTAEEAIRSYELVRRCGFDNVNVDLIYGVPGQTLESWLTTLEQVIVMGPEHISAYELTIEADTEFFAKFGMINSEEHEELVCSMYEAALDVLGKAGFTQYEVSNFARGGMESIELLPRYACLHNVNYWRGGEYLGLGPSAASYVDGIRATNVDDVVTYCEILEQGVRPIHYAEKLGPLARAGEIAAFGLRMVAGWDLSEFRELTGFDLLEHWGCEIQEIIQKGWGMLADNRFRLTPAGLRFADSVAELFIR